MEVANLSVFMLLSGFFMHDQDERQKLSAAVAQDCAEFGSTSMRADGSSIDPWIPEAADGAQVVDAEPLVRSPPRYPYRAFREGLPHVCLYVRFDVNEQGRTENGEIIFKAPKGATNDFDRATLKSIKNWRYKPATVNNVSVRREDVITLVGFDLN